MLQAWTQLDKYIQNEALSGVRITASETPAHLSDKALLLYNVHSMEID